MLKTVKFFGGVSVRADFDETALEAIYKPLRTGENIAVACSGGADSVFLLFSILSIFESFADRILVLHFNHKARANSEIDEVFVRELCRKLSVKCVCGAPEYPPSKKSEEVFRRMRLRFFKDCTRRLNIGAIAQGHHADDLCETLLMRVMRGAGTDGLAALRPVSKCGAVTFARPLLNLRKMRISDFLRSVKIQWREDESNASADFFRNRVRLEMLPLIEKISPSDFRVCAARTRALAQEDSDFLLGAFREGLSECGNADFLRNAEIFASDAGSEFLRLKLPPRFAREPAMLRRAAQLLLGSSAMSESIRAKGVDAFVAKISNGAKNASASVGRYFLCWDALGGQMFLHNPIVSSSNELELARLVLGENKLPWGGVLTVSKVELSEERLAGILAGNNDNRARAYLSVPALGERCDATNSLLFARKKKSSDKYRPLGSTVPKKISDMFSAGKVSLLKRKILPIVLNINGAILWVPSLPPCADFALTVNSHAALELTFISGKD